MKPGPGSSHRMDLMHDLDADDVIACGCTEHVSWTFRSGRVTCPDCRRILEARRGADWMAEVAADLAPGESSDTE